ncbi:hypothetical protein L2K70_12760 [Nocardioides KLBMP 9356]|uniref:WXG100 family type VII secretion target n=1 Tax=Nocardioides potassii TaxID=2911371 RepID=A0ABS9HBD2_9ACTN|nr:hypothetical protein [Nocardioides potassii]MCF6378475.1 hypothetical protein [Nocardioides potassii]
MSGMIGADPDALERLAGDFDRGAGSLESIALKVRTSVHANPWAGARATRFRADWDQRHGPQLKRTALALRTAAKQLRIQAQEQRQASSAGGGVFGGLWAAGRDGSASRPSLDDLADALWMVKTSAAITAALGRWNMYQNYPAHYRDLLSHLERLPRVGQLFRDGRIPDFFRYNKSPVLQMLARDGITSTLKPAAGVLGNVAKGAGVLGTAASVVDNVVKAADAAQGDSLSAKITAGTYALDAASDAAIESKAGFLYGTAGKAVAMAVREGAKADFSSAGQSLVMGEIARNPGVVGEELGKATLQVGQTVVSWFAPIPAALK